VRGEGGVAVSGTEPQHPAIPGDTKGTYYHKKLWAHVGVLGYSCDGEWYPRLFVPTSTTQFPTSTRSLEKMFAAYERFMQGEPVSNGRYQEIGTDLTGTRQVLLSNTTGSLRAWGRLDATAGKGLLWIDNASDTWWNAVQGSPVAGAGASLAIQGLSAGTYAVEWWDTTAGAMSRTETRLVGGDGRLSLAVSNLTGDVAVKFRNTEAASQVQVSIPLRQGWNLVASSVLPGDPAPGTVLALISGQYSAVFAYDACDAVDPWKKYDPAAPPFVNDLVSIDAAQGLWILATADTTLTITGTIPASLDLTLCSGANLIGYPVATPVVLPEALASIAGKYSLVCTYEAADAADPWKAFYPAAPPVVSDLNSMGAGKGYWVQMTEPALLLMGSLP
jgi:hypothetical protein